MAENSSRTPRILRRIGTSAVAALLVLAVFVMGVWVGGHPRESGLDRAPSAIRDRLLADDRTAAANQVLSILASDFYRELPPEKLAAMEDASVQALVAAVEDPYTEYLTQEDFAKYLDSRSGTYVGVGIQWRPENKRATVLRVNEGGPAATAGVKPKDVILAVDGKPVNEATRFAAMDTVKGEPHTDVVLRIRRANTADRDYRMTRAEIREQVVDARIENVDGKRVGVVRLSRFTTGSAKDFRDEVTSFADASVAGIVVDLRGNPGGLVNEAQDVVGAFVPKGTTVATTTHRNGPQETLTTGDAPVVDDEVRVVVVTNTHSASASEIVAGALRDVRGSRLVGTHTFGKALIQTTRRLSNGGALKFTTASYLTPKGFDLGRNGLQPDVKVQDDPDTPADEQIDRALREAVTP